MKATIEGAGGAIPTVAPQFDLVVRMLGDIDMRELMVWCADPDWHAPVAMALAVVPETGRIAHSHVAYGQGRTSAAVLDRGERKAWRAFMMCELVRWRAPMRTAIDNVLAAVTRGTPAATVNALDAFTLRTARAYTQNAEDRSFGSADPERRGFLPGQIAERPNVAFQPGRRSGSARNIDAIAEELARWIERRYYHDDWRPDDTNSVEIAAAFSRIVTAHNRELGDMVPVRAVLGLPAPRPLPGRVPGIRAEA